MAQCAGFCYGVKRAVETTKKIKLENKAKNVWVLGELIHNSHVIKELEEQGIRIIRAEDLIKDINTNTEKYRLSDDKGHPNKKAWEDLVPKFADAVNF